MRTMKQIWKEGGEASRKRLAALILALALCLGIIPAGIPAMAQPSPAGYIVLSIEKFILGRGWIFEPRQIPFYEGDYAGNVITRALGAGMVTNGDKGMGTIVETPGANLSYINRIKDEDETIDPPQYVKDKKGWPFSSGRAYPGWLGQFDYGASGWVYTRNNVFPSVGLGACGLENNLVIRLQFSLYLGDGTGSSGLSVNRDALARRLAFINSAADKAAMLADPSLKAAYDAANAVFSDLTSTQADVDGALSVLNASLPGSSDLFLLYDLNGGTGAAVDSTAYKEGGDALLLSEKGLSHPEDKDFANWNTKADGTGDAYLPGNSVTFGKEDLTLYAIWDKPYRVTYDVNAANGGGNSTAPADTASYLPGRTVTLKAITAANSKPETGKVFKEWNTKADGSGDSYGSTGKMAMPRRDVTLYAIWANGYRITYNGNGHTAGTVPAATAYYLPGAAVTINNNTTLYKNTQRAAWWNTNAIGTGATYNFSQSIAMPEQDLTLYAFYRDTYTVTYNANGGNGAPPVNANRYLPGANVPFGNGSALTKPGGFVFKEWNTSADGSGTSYTAAFPMGMEDLTLYAIYTQGYSVTYDLNGGAGTVPVDTAYYKPGGSFYTKGPSPALTGPDGKKHLSWNTRADGTGASYKLSSGSVPMGDGNMTLYAVYSSTYSITYNLNGGVSGVPNTTAGHLPGDYVYLRDAVNGQLAANGATHPTGQPGKVFKGWSPDRDDPSQAVTTYTMPAYDVTLYAVWADGVSLKYDLNGGSGAVPADNALYGGDRKTYPSAASSAGLTPPEGTLFYRWSNTPDGSGGLVASGAGFYITGSGPFGELPAGETTLYAIWRPQYRLHYDTNGGGTVASSALTFDGLTVSVTSTVPAKAGVTFRYWNTRPDGSGIDYKAGEALRLSGGDITLYARWSANKVYYNANGGTGDAPVDGVLYTPNQEITAPGAPGLTAPAGQRFIAWNTKADGTGVFVTPGNTIRMAKGDLTLYAVWRDAVADNNLALHLAKLLEAVPAPGVGTLAGEWSVMALARAGYSVPANYYRSYYAEAAKVLKETGGVLDRVKYTEYSRVIMALSAIGYDPGAIAGYNMLSYLTDMNKISLQGINGPVFALIALDSRGYDVMENETAANQATRDKLTGAILDREIPGGGWSLAGDAPDADITAMVLQALAPYKDQPDVGACIGRALAKLSELQDASGRFGGIDGVCAESAAQAVIALTALGVNPETDPRFVKPSGNALSGLLLYALPEGGFEHVLGGGYDPMAADQGILALVAFDRFLNDANRLYDMSDVTPVPNPDYVAPDKKDVTVTDENGTGVAVTAKEGVFPSGTELWVDPVDSGPKYDKAKTALGDKSAGGFRLYDIFLLKNNVEIQPNGKITISIPVPAGYDGAKCRVYRMNDDGTVTDMNAVLKDGFLTFETDHLSLYAVAQQAPGSSGATDHTASGGKNNADGTGNPETGDSGPVTLWLCLGAALFMAGALSRRKKASA